MKWTWEELWEFRASLTDSRLRNRLDREVGFILFNGKLHITPKLYQQLTTCAPETLRRRLTGAPRYLIHAVGFKLGNRALRNLLEKATDE